MYYTSRDCQQRKEINRKDKEINNDGHNKAIIKASNVAVSFQNGTSASYINVEKKIKATGLSMVSNPQGRIWF